MTFVGVPTYSHSVDMGQADALLRASRHSSCAILHHNAPLLAFNFNHLLCQALNNRARLGITRFLLWHADICPTIEDPLSVMSDEMDRLGLQALSAVVAIKDKRGLTSTGLDMSGLPECADRPWATRRLTMAEVVKLPETFNASEAAAGIDFWDPDHRPVLLINTGLMMLDLRTDWLTEMIEHEAAWFTIRDRIVRDAEGHFRAHCEPEDWNFSRKMARRGVRYAATRKIPINHPGRLDYGNVSAWGEHQRDPAFSYELTEVS